MKSIIIYYSHYGSTAYLSEKFSQTLEKLGKTELKQLEYSQPRQSLFKRTFYRFLPHLVRLAPIVTDLKDYELVCLGIPVWGGKPSAPVTRYLHLCKNLEQKKIICYYVFGIQSSAERCAQFIEKILRNKGVAQISRAFIPWGKINDDEFLDKVITEALSKLDL